MAESKNSLEKTVSISNGVFRLGAYVITLVGFFIYMHFNLNANTKDIAQNANDIETERKARIELEKAIIRIDVNMVYMRDKLDGVK